MSVVIRIDGIPLKGRWLSGRARPWAHNRGCSCQPHQTFTCDRCGRRVGWCLGAHDNMPGACDFCWRPR